MKTINCLIMALFFEIIVLCLLISFRFVNPESTGILLIFNLLFITLTIYLRGSLNRKLGVLTLGNIIGVLWNAIFQALAIAGTGSFGQIFSSLYLVLFPFLNSLWLVSFWSLSLTILQNPKQETGR